MIKRIIGIVAAVAIAGVLVMVIINRRNYRSLISPKAEPEAISTSENIIREAPAAVIPADSLIQADSTEQVPAVERLTNKTTAPEE